MDVLIDPANGRPLGYMELRGIGRRAVTVAGEMRHAASQLRALAALVDDTADVLESAGQTKYCWSPKLCAQAGEMRDRAKLIGTMCVDHQEAVLQTKVDLDLEVE